MKSLALLLVVVYVSVVSARIAVGPKIVDNVHARASGNRVVGGEDAKLEDAPYQVSFLAQGWLGKSHICGGSLLSANKVITAAHCCDGQTASQLEVRWGGNKRSSLPYGSPVKSLSVHKDWNTNTIDNDYCILTLTSSATETNGVKFVKLAATTPGDGTAATLTGWGRTSGSGSLPETLQKADLNIIGPDKCQAGWTGVNDITKAMVCAGHLSRSGCNGDSGGPLVSGGVQVGIVSWGASGCPANTVTRPTVYADVANGKTWLENNIQPTPTMRTVSSVSILVFCLSVTVNAFVEISPEFGRKSLASPGARVVGGTPASATQSPFQASLNAQSLFGSSHICGGSLVGQRSVITAAHCCDGYTADKLTIKYDGLDRTKLKVTNKVTKVAQHDQYNGNTIDYDYCVLTLENPIVQSTTVSTIELVSTPPQHGSPAHLTGWGKISGSTSSLPVQLQYTPMAIVSREECNKIWEPAGQTVTARMICASNRAASGCNGDSGGPLVVDGKLVGIVSWVYRGCPANTEEWPTAYADVANSRQWLDERIQ
ncbi:transmembrane protease serine 9-like [Oppia nitens]|uniref:transmembrane protease serine 9-like n=1 Tax=Oppia nitens TaxID=1686743 RepID=UPI0023DAEBAB|nr:transmembrane protease serine 9-like [Oppia nitens]